MASEGGDKISVRVNKKASKPNAETVAAKKEAPKIEPQHAYLQNVPKNTEPNEESESRQQPSRRSNTIQPIEKTTPEETSEPTETTSSDSSKSMPEPETSNESSAPEEVTEETIATDTEAIDDYGQKAPTVADYAHQQPPQGFADEDTRDYRLNLRQLKKPPKRSGLTPPWVRNVLILIVMAGLVVAGVYYVSRYSL